MVGQGLEEQVVQRDENSWLIDGGTPIEDVIVWTLMSCRRSGDLRDHRRLYDVYAA